MDHQEIINQIYCGCYSERKWQVSDDDNLETATQKPFLSFERKVDISSIATDTCACISVVTH